ncbi:MAG: hypothetical protein Q607_CBUC00038G0020 [Clostridium butyricum DORA_1]|nr:MAG: hypothetical protein Q607_CBUC00038G0020 [Clostridium butyricum DORA_1]MDU1509980.1 DUF262 domain-containing protein [Clostridium butyricum]
MNKDNPETLFELLTKYKVEIPIVQRDYAQGRKDGHSTRVRKKLLNDMKSAVLGNTAPLDLNFVYGKSQNEKFIPLDGQQRLTTLFLLHIYAYSNNEDKDITNLLLRFTYETRKSSRDFLEKLVENRKSIFESEVCPSEEIKDSTWFTYSWKNDPTVMSILVMLDDIKAEFDDVENLSLRLSNFEKKPITFHFLDIKNIGMEDSLYIKLNARGRSLTTFENFKARLIGRIKRLKLNLPKDFELCIDHEWTDLFWSQSKERFDETYLTFFGVLFMNKFCIQKNDGEENEEILDDTDIDWSNKLDYEIIDYEIIETVFYILDFMSNNKNELIRKNIFDALNEKRTYKNRILFHAIVKYFYMSKGNYDNSFEQWFRIIKNLINNTQIDDKKTYKRAIEGINKLAENFDNLLKYFANEGVVSGFLQEQIKEEQIKAKIIINDKKFAEEIYKAEQHPYFGGKICSALYYAEDNSHKYNMEIFLLYWNKISELFDETKPKYRNLMRQALLTFGDYTLEVGEYKTLCVDDPNESYRTPSLKQLFSRHGEIVKRFLDSLDINKDIKIQLNEIIRNSNIIKNDWRYCFIAFPELFQCMSNSHLRLREVDGQLIMIPNKASSGYNYDVFLQALKIRLNREKLEATLYAYYGAWGDRYLYIESKNIYVRFYKGQFNIRNKDNKTVFISNSNNPIAEVLEYILKN